MLYLSSKRLYICVDGLDGLVEDQLELFLKLIMKMLSLGARIMIFNRRFPRIEECFQDDAALVSVEDLRGINNIRLYLGSRVIRSRYLQVRADLQYTIVDTLTKHAQGM